MFFGAGFLFSQDTSGSGCTDPQANNYNPLADTNDGSCTYNPTIYHLDFKYLLSDVVEETSGLIFWNDILWTINDSGNDPILFSIDTTTGIILQQIMVSNAQNIDWESLAQDDDYIYIGDFGNNSGARDDLGIYKVKKNDIPNSGDASVTSTHITFSYADFKEIPEKRKYNNFDCEAFICAGDSLYLFSKNWGNEKTKLYRLPKDEGDYTAELLKEYDVSGLVCGADYNRESKEITLVGYTNNNYVPFLWLLFDYYDNNFFSGNKRRIDLLNIQATQTEAIAYADGKSGFITSEGSVIFTQSAYGFSTATWTDSLTTGIGVKEVKDFDFVLSPNPVQKSKLTVFIERLPAGDYQIELFDTSGSLIQISDYKVKTERGSVKVKLKVGQLKPGLYFVRMRSVHTIVEKKFIKQ